MLSDRIRPNSEAAPWVIEEVKVLEKKVELLREIGEYLEGHPHNAVFAGSKFHQDIRQLFKDLKRHCTPCDGSVDPEQVARCGFGRCPHKRRP